MRDYTKWALQGNIGWAEFEDICSDYLFLNGYPSIRQVGRVGDGGRDAVVLRGHEEDAVFAFSMEDKPLAGSSGKFHTEYAKWRGSGIERFVFVSNRDLGAGKIDVPKEFVDPPVEIHDITDLVRFLDLTEEGRQVKLVRGLGDDTRTGTESTLDLRAATEYTLFNVTDLSHSGAKRYRADVLLNREVSKDRAREILREATDAVRQSDYHKSEVLRARWAEREADVVWLFLFPSYDDLEHNNWACRSQWISASLDDAFKPMQLVTQDEAAGIRFDWNDMYQALADHNVSHTLSKEAYLREMLALFEPASELVSDAEALLESYDQDELSWAALQERIAPIEERLSKLYFKSNDLGFAPLECKELDTAFEQAIAIGHNVVLPFSSFGREKPSEKEAIRQMRQALAGYPRHARAVKSGLLEFRS